MKAVRIHQWGQPVQVEDVPQPIPEKDEVLVRVHAASLNPVDSFAVAGYMQSMLSLPYIPGTDLAGEVVAGGSAVTHVKPGDAVYGMIAFRGGTFAEFATVKGTEVAAKPQSLDYIQAAAAPLTALAAWQTVIDLAQVQPGERVLIHGAGGSVGSFALELAKDRGVHVIASDVASRQAFLQELGADKIINAETQRFEDVVERVDVVLNYASPDLLGRSYSVITPGGRYVTTLGEPSQPEAEARGIRSFGVMAHPTIEHLGQIAKMIDTGKLKVSVQRTFRLEEAQAAFDYRQADTQPGKVVLTLTE
jgi:NADPH:quinone reductase-like Zn-dependent oxidoreductase